MWATRTWPTVARQRLGMIFLAPDGSFTRVMPESTLCATTMA